MTKKELFDLENEYHISIGGSGDDEPFDEYDNYEPYCYGVYCNDCILNKNGGCHDAEIKEQFLIEWDKKRKEKVTPPCFEFDWDAFKHRKIIVKCTSEEECKEFVKACYENGVKWSGNHDEGCTRWNNTSNHILYIGENSTLTYWCGKLYIEEANEVVDFSDIKSGINQLDLSKFTDTQLLAEIKRRLERGVR
ncbi:MAG: hypothetical protein PHX08_08200 [Lachnospiraceae bacterium]|nr:hypothetical protein [Lachnospiraceae bacterium]